MRDVRQRCGFGCVFCGLAIYDYEHFDPTFANAKEHKAEGITLLCLRHHGHKNRGFLTAKQVAQANEKPFARQAGFAHEAFNTGPDSPSFLFGGNRFEGSSGIVLNGEYIIGGLPPEVPGGPTRLTANLCNKNGSEILRIKDNVWSVPAGNWDVDVEGTTISIRNQLGDIALVFRPEPPDLLVIERLTMFIKGLYVHADKDHFELGGGPPSKSK